MLTQSASWLYGRCRLSSFSRASISRASPSLDTQTPYSAYAPEAHRADPRPIS